MTDLWKCDCGHIEYGKYPPEECSKCWKVNSFIEVPEDVAEQIKDRVLGNRRGDNLDEDEDLEEEELL